MQTFTIYNLIESKFIFDEKHDDLFTFVLSENKSISINEENFRELLNKSLRIKNLYYDESCDESYPCIRFYKLGDVWVDSSLSKAYYEMVYCRAYRMVQLVPKGTFYEAPGIKAEYFTVFDFKQVDYSSHWPEKQDDPENKN